MENQMKSQKKEKNRNLEIKREDWEILREYKKAPFKEKYLKNEAILNSIQTLMDSRN